LLALITISHRPTLNKYHKSLLTLGTGSEGHEWEFNQIGGVEERLSLEREIADLELKLQQIEGHKKRLAEVESDLNNK
jgi:hypothetical protein